MTRPSTQPRNPESGYAMLLVFAMSAIIAIELYEQLPRAAFEAQREKENLLVDHGEQYKRAVQLYCRKLGRYPAKIEDLDNTQNIRFLRRHFIDPLTGKEEWRLLHMGPAGKLIDSKIEAPNSNQDQWHAGSITEFKSPASSDAGGPEAINLATRKRASDEQTLGPMGGGAPSAPANNDPAALSLNSPQPQGQGLPGSTIPQGTPGAPQPPGTPNTPAWLNGGAGLPGMPPGMRNLTVPQGVRNPTGNSTAPNGSGSGSSVAGNGGFGSSISGNGGFGDPSAAPSTNPIALNPNNGQPVNSQYQGQSPQSYPTAPGSNLNPNNPFAQPGQTTNGQLSPAGMINSLLTSPRPGGAPAGIGQPGIGGSVVGGLAGVASTYRGHGIKRYADQDEYQKWEFFYDFGAEMRGNVQTQGNVPLNTNPAGTTNPNSGAGSTGFGNTGSTGFGGNGGGFGGGNNLPTPPAQPVQPH